MSTIKLKNISEPIEPQLLPIDLSRIIYDMDIIKRISKANQEICTYRGFLSNLQNPFLLTSPLIGQEAVLSSKLEGTHATLEDWLNYEAGNEVRVEKDDLLEITNYRHALYIGLSDMGTISEEGSKLPLCNRVIKNLHSVLLQSGRGSSKNPGQFKQHQNYIGGSGGIELVPVAPKNVDTYMSNLENYFHFEEVDLLIQTAIIHVQFEMIHPFEDGNGRIGRLLIPLFLYYRELLPAPTFYMSRYFESNRDKYIDSLAAVSKRNDWRTWISYFLDGVILEAASNTSKARAILNLYEEYKGRSLRTISSKHTIDVLDFIFETPLFSAAQLMKRIKTSSPTVYTLLNKFEEEGILKNTGEARNRTYFCPVLLSIIQGV